MQQGQLLQDTQELNPPIPAAIRCCRRTARGGSICRQQRVKHLCGCVRACCCCCCCPLLFGCWLPCCTQPGGCMVLLLLVLCWLWLQDALEVVHDAAKQGCQARTGGC